LRARRSSEETAEITCNLVKRLYGDKVRVEYYDMAMPDEAASQAHLVAKVPGNRQFYPMVFINDELKSVGSAEYHQVLYLVRETID